MASAVRETLLALNIWIGKYNLVVDECGASLSLMLPLCKKDYLEKGRIKITEDVSEMLETLMIPKEEIDYVLSSDKSIRLHQKMFSLFCKSHLFLPELVERASFKSGHRYEICNKYENYVDDAFGISDCDVPIESTEAACSILIKNIKDKYPRVGKQFERLREQAIFYDYMYDMMSSEDRKDSKMLRLFNIFVRLRGIRWFSKMDEKEIKADWEEFKSNGLTTAEDWQCLFINEIKHH